ncbi:MAG: pyridoxamine 5'-phosphate oxidase family protein [Eubacteriales bacterium]|nr:pyridoxamine 5'-phosphate oxidase family protein [Eubacteriales bacterium]
MRRKDREVTDYKKMLEILEQCDCCRLGLNEEAGAYVVPLNFGYEDQDGQLTLYFHGAMEGKKMELIRQQGRAGFELDRNHALVMGETACAWSWKYQSIMGKGSLRILEDSEEKRHGLNRIMEHYSRKGAWAFPEQMVNCVCVLSLTVAEWSCKEH